MRVESHWTDGALRLLFTGGDALDAHTAPSVKQQARRLVDGRANVVIDLSGLEFVDSVGLSVLVGLFKAVRANGCRASFTGVRPGVRRVMEIIRLDEIFELQPDRETAVGVPPG